MSHQTRARDNPARCWSSPCDHPNTCTGSSQAVSLHAGSQLTRGRRTCRKCRPGSSGLWGVGGPGPAVQKAALGPGFPSNGSAYPGPDGTLALPPGGALGGAEEPAGAGVREDPEPEWSLHRSSCPTACPLGTPEPQVTAYTHFLMSGEPGMEPSSLTPSPTPAPAPAPALSVQRPSSGLTAKRAV